MPPCAIEFFDRFAAEARALPPDQKRELDDVLRRLAQTFGQPHLHSGLGIRRLERDYFECRMGRDLRLAFKLQGRTLYMARLGNHDDIRRFICNGSDTPKLASAWLECRSLLAGDENCAAGAGSGSATGSPASSLLQRKSGRCGMADG